VNLNSIMKRVGRALEFLAWAVFFAFAALVLALRFWLLPDVERYRDQIAAAVTRTVGKPVRIGRIEAGWLGLNPRLSLSDVRIYDHEGREALVLPSVENVLSWRSVLRGEPKLHSLVIEGLRLQMRRDRDGVLYVAGRKLSGEGGFTDWALAQDEIEVRDAEIEWHDEKRGAPPLALSGVNLRMRNSGNEHAIGLTARPSAELGSSVELRALLGGRTVADLAAWSGRLYAEFGYTDLAAWRAWIDYPWDVKQGQGALRLWLTLESGEVKQATADLALARVSASLGAELAQLQLASVQGRLKGRVLRDGYELTGRGLAMRAQDGPAAAPTDFQLSWKPGAGAAEPRGSLAASLIELEPLAHLGASLPLLEEARKLLATVAPRGRLADAKLEWSGPPEAPRRFIARASFTDLAVDPWKAVPGFTGVSGSFEANELGGRVQLVSRNGELRMPHVFPDARIAFDVLNGSVDWERHGERVVALRSQSLNFANADLSGNVHGSYTYTGDGPGTVDLWAQVNRADARHVAKYLPHAAFLGGQETRDWLVRAIVAGHSSDARLRLRGDLREFPFKDPLRGQFNVTARIEKGVLDYAAGWPRIEAIEGELAFERSRMQIMGRSGVVGGAALSNVRVGIANLGEPDPQLTVDGEADGATADFLKFIATSPVRGMIDGATDAMRASGRGRLHLKLALPLKEREKTQVAGDYELIGNEVVVGEELPAIERASGRVSFTESTLTVHEVRGRLFGGALALSGGTRPDKSIEVQARGDATVAAMRALFDHPWRSYLSGGASYVATVNVAQGRMRVSFESSLRGVTSTLPAPLAKEAGEALPLRVAVAPAGDGARHRVSVELGRLLAAEILRRRQGEAMVVQRAAVSLTPAPEQPLRLPQRPGTFVYGSLTALNVDSWLPLLSDGDAPADVTSFDVRIGKLDLYGRRLNEIALRAGIDAAGWSASVNAQELAGDLSYRSAQGGRLLARLTHFRMPGDYPGAKPRDAAQPKDLPSVDAVVERFSWSGKELGRVELAAQRVGEDWRVEKFAIVNPDATMTGSGMWRGGTPTQSSVRFELQANDPGEFLGRVGYPGLVKGGKARMQGSLAWNGEPAAFNYPSLSGELQLQAQDGQFLEIEPGFGKLVSLMSLQSLPRRITLDFRDVFSKGFEFERLATSGGIDAGVMTVKDFHMRGAGAQVEMTGEVDLARETQKLRVRVVPSLGDSASTVIALVNPLLAIPAVIAQKILKDPLGHIFAFDYSVTGSWTDPIVEKLGVEARPVDAPPGQ
jgi:uncharacterized protein (TIGR02099 family)